MVSSCSTIPGLGGLLSTQLPLSLLSNLQGLPGAVLLPAGPVGAAPSCPRTVSVLLSSCGTSSRDFDTLMFHKTSRWSAPRRLCRMDLMTGEGACTQRAFARCVIRRVGDEPRSWPETGTTPVTCRDDFTCVINHWRELLAGDRALPQRHTACEGGAATTCRTAGTYPERSSRDDSSPPLKAGIPLSGGGGAVAHVLAEPRAASLSWCTGSRLLVAQGAR